MKLVHTRSKKGRRGHKWFPGQAHRMTMPSLGTIPGLFAAIFGGRR